MKKMLLLAGVAALFSANANAYEMKPYVGLDYVYSMLDIDKIDGEKVFEEDLNAFAVSVGTKFHENFGVGAFYQHSDEETKTVKTIIGDVKGKDKYNAYGLDVVGYMPVAEKVDLLGSLGIGYYDVKAKLVHAPTGVSVKGDDDGFGYRIGAGVQYNMTENWGARVMARYAYTDIDGLDNIVDLTAGIRYSF